MHRSAADVCVSEAVVATSAEVRWATCSTGMLAHFTRQVGAAAPTAVFGGSIGATTNGQLLPLTDATAYALLPGRGSDQAQIEATRDGGRTARRLGGLPHGVGRHEVRVAFPTPSTGYLVDLDTGRLYRTDDAVRSWREVPLP